MRSEARLTYDDLAALPPDELRHELLDGVHIVTPSPSLTHQRVVARLFRMLDDHAEARGGEAFLAPVDVILGPGDVVVPDVVVVKHDKGVTERAIEAPPALAVEVLSPSTRRLDLGAKKRRCELFGVEEYWVVDPVARSVTCFRLDPGTKRFRESARAAGEERLSPPGWAGLTLDLAALFAARRAPR